MVARAVGAGIAIGVGATLALPQVFMATPRPAFVLGGLLLIIGGAIAAADLAAWERKNRVSPPRPKLRRQPRT